jgi:hypothetical protein
MFATWLSSRAPKSRCRRGSGYISSCGAAWTAGAVEACKLVCCGIWVCMYAAALLLLLQQQQL